MSDRLMDRVAQLNEVAKECLGYERESIGQTLSPSAARLATYGLLVERARYLGFPENEISSAIDTALGGR